MGNGTLLVCTRLATAASSRCPALELSLHAPDAFCNFKFQIPGFQLQPLKLCSGIGGDLGLRIRGSWVLGFTSLRSACPRLAVYLPLLISLRCSNDDAPEDMGLASTRACLRVDRMGLGGEYVWSRAGLRSVTLPLGFESTSRSGGVSRSRS